MKNATTSIDIETMKSLIQMLTPAPIAPILPLTQTISDFNKGSQNLAELNVSLQYLTKTVDEIKQQLKEITNNHVTITDFNDHVTENSKAHADYELRLRDFSTNITRITTWGSIIFILGTLAQIALRFTGH